MADDKGLGLKNWLTGPGRHETKVEVASEKPIPSNLHRVAVLPFASMSPDVADDYFVDGITEEVISTLSRVRDVEVVSRTSIMHYKKNPQPIKMVSQELGVDTILEGGVRKAGNRLRITIQMIDAKKDQPVWADSYDRELQDVFAIQSEVAARVADALRIKYSGSEASLRKNPTDKTEALNFYLKGRYFWNKRGIEDLKLAMGYFEQAIKEDPRFALGFVGLADCHQILRSNWNIEPSVNFEKAKGYISKALALDPELAEAHTTKALLFLDEFKLKDAELEFGKALDLNPSYALAHQWYHIQLRAQRRWAEALQQIEKGLELDPFSASMRLAYAWYHVFREDYRSAIPSAKKSADLNPSFALAHDTLAYLSGKLGMLEEARREYTISVKLVQESQPLAAKGTEASLAWFADDKEKLRRLLPQLETNMDQAGMSRVEIALFYFYLDQFDKAFDWLEQAYSHRDWDLVNLPILPEIPEKARQDRRYMSLLSKLGLD